MTATHGRQGHPPIEPIVRDEVLTMGTEGQLVGIVSHPRDASRARSRLPHASHGQPALIVLNAGVLHRVGPHRLHVVLARRAAAAGVPGMRLDLGGIGDSISSSDATSFRDSAVADTRTAMTGLSGAIGAERFVLFGVCAGADNALATALVDDRVAGIVLVDPPAYPTLRSQLRAVRARAERTGIREVVRWGLGVADRRLRSAISTIGRARVEAPPSEGREIPPAEVFGRQLAAVADRGTRILAVYSGIHGPRYNHEGQLAERFPALRGRIDLAYFPTANHTFTELAAQSELIETAVGWIVKRFG